MKKITWQYYCRSKHRARITTPASFVSTRFFESFLMIRSQHATKFRNPRRFPNSFCENSDMVAYTFTFVNVSETGYMHTTERSSKLVATWLLIGVAMTVIQIALGGITRLTGSGLSITEWDVITGSLPPLNEQQWLAEFNKYRQTPQYHLLNFDFTLSDFKFIFFWEWFHRLWARTIGLVF